MHCAYKVTEGIIRDSLPILDLTFNDGEAAVQIAGAATPAAVLTWTCVF